MSGKFCIFCGEKPKNKNLEHVIPQWLIRLSNNEHEDVYSLFPEGHRKINFMQFKFPACTECNSKYAELEAKVKGIMEKVLAGQSINGMEASLLMDWFDKIRVGMWLTHMCFDHDLKNNIQPYFFIDSRVARADRMLSVHKILESNTEPGVLLGGISSPLFMYSPSTFTMRINNYYFINASTPNLVSPRVGFPSVANVYLRNMDEGTFNCDIINGRDKVVNPIIQSFIPNKDSITFYQPIYKDFVSFKTFPKDDYLIQHSYDEANGLGGVFVQKGNVGNTRYLNPTDNVSLRLKVRAPFDMLKETFATQNAVNAMTKTQNYETVYGAYLNNLFLKTRGN